MEFLSQFVVILVVGICLAVGYIIKHSLSFIPNKYIPLIMGILGIVINVWMSDWTFSPEILLGGLASGLASTGAFELARNISSKEENISSKEEAKYSKDEAKSSKDEAKSSKDEDRSKAITNIKGSN